MEWASFSNYHSEGLEGAIKTDIFLSLMPERNIDEREPFPTPDWPTWQRIDDEYDSSPAFVKDVRQENHQRNMRFQ